MDKRKSDIPDEHHRPVTGEWLPQDHRHHKDWLGKVNEHVKQNPKELHPCLKEFKELIEADTNLTMLSQAMFDQVPRRAPYNKSVDQNQVVRNFKQLLAILNHILTTGPEWTDRAHRVGVVGVPINAVLDYNMGTTAGFAFFLNDQVNAQIKKILNVWGDFLKSTDSASCLEGWLTDGVASLQEVANKARGTNESFEQLFKCDPSKKYYGYTSWDDFFTRELKDGARPLASPEDDSVIVNACESKTYCIQHDIKYRDKFWIKGQPYSAVDMLGHDILAEKFTGGTVYQAFLSALSYHRWHAPVSGKIHKWFIVPGTYYSEPEWEDFSENKGADVHAQTPSQGYLTASATRAVVFIEADNPAIGLIGLLFIG